MRIFGLLITTRKAVWNYYRPKIFNAIDWGRMEERDRIKQVIQDWFDSDCDTSEGPKHLLDWIDEGDNK
jgi:hypothetical protein